MEKQYKSNLTTLIYLLGLLGGVFLFIYGYATLQAEYAVLSVFVYMFCTWIYNKYRV